MEAIYYSFAEAGEKEAIGYLLSECELPDEDIVGHLDNFILAKNNNKKLVGVIGLEVYNTIGLLRSLAVKPSYRGRGIAKILYSQILGYAHLQGIRELYLLTLTAEKFFEKLGFAVLGRDDLPQAVRATEEFRSLCPASAVCMSKNITTEMQYFPGEVLRLRPDITGANMWGVALEKSMFTYFEIEPHSRFEKHYHQSEQITMVLEGKLFFEAGDRTIIVHPGEVAAIPSNVPHAVYTEEEPVKAVDAWSPLRDRYKNRR
jgi:amino-acid N-acetyltransferase